MNLEDIVNSQKKKIKFEDLTIEITRKCQLKCAHCFRGDAQNLDIPYSVIDKVLEQVDHIEYLSLFGGEPLININGIRYVLEILKKNEIRLDQLEIISNGVIVSKDVIDIINEYDDYIRKWNNEDEYIKRKMIYFCISVDKYHVGYNSMESYYLYKHAFADRKTIKVAINSVGEFPIHEGRAKNLEVGYDFGQRIPTKIEYYTSERTEAPCCFNKYYKSKVEHNNQIFIPCRMYISAKGDLYNTPKAPLTYDEMDTPNNFLICNVLKTYIIDGILKYNEGKRLLCLPLCIHIQNKEKSKAINQNEKNLEAFRMMESNFDSANILMYENSSEFEADEWLNQWIEYKEKYHVDAYGNSTK